MIWQKSGGRGAPPDILSRFFVRSLTFFLHAKKRKSKQIVFLSAFPLLFLFQNIYCFCLLKYRFFIKILIFFNPRAFPAAHQKSI